MMFAGCISQLKPESGQTESMLLVLE